MLDMYVCLLCVAVWSVCSLYLLQTYKYISSTVCTETQKT